ncbi:MAG: hypothetical protein ACRYFU_17205 [Janthinobacterium lividum]
MEITYGAERGRALGSAYILFIACLTVPMTVFRALHPNGWTPGDWLVNYEGGFVRRGLPGELILGLAHGLHLSPVLIGSLLPLFFYVLLYFSVWQLYRQSSGDLWTFAALVSPATLAFPILDPVGAFRKELLFLLALAFVLFWLTRRKPTDLALTAFVTATGVLAILSHEGLLPYLLYLVGALLIGLNDLKRVAKILILPAIATAGTLAAVLRYRGNALEEQAICRSLGSAPPIVCSGSIAYLANGTDIARADVMRNIHAYHYLFYYPLLTILALLPLAAMAVRFFRERRLRPDLLVISTTALLSLLASLPLFLYAMDWGRWIYIHVLSLFLLLLFVDIREREVPSPSMQPVGPAFRASRPPRWSLAMLLVYATCWNIPHYGNYPKKGYLNIPLHLLKEEMDHRRSARSAPSSAAKGQALMRELPHAESVASRVRHQG